MTKVVEAHETPIGLMRFCSLPGHGYNSESMTARMDEKAALLQQFPQLNRQDNGLEYIDYTFDEHIKNRLLSAMTIEQADIALLHHHGSTDAQLAGSEAAANGVQQNIESIKFYLRSKVRGAKDKQMPRSGIWSGWMSLIHGLRGQTRKFSRKRIRHGLPTWMLFIKIGEI